MKKLKIKNSLNLILYLLLIFTSTLTFAEENNNPRLEGHYVKNIDDGPFLGRVERAIGLTTGIHQRIEFDTGEEMSFNVGPGVEAIPLYAKIKFLLNPKKDLSPYGVVSTGINYVDGEDISVNKFIGDLSQRLNYGIGVGIDFKKFEVEIIYGKYKYEMLGNPHEETKDFYRTTRLSLNIKYVF